MRIVFLLLALLWPCICEAESDISADDLLSRAVSLAAAGQLEESEQLLLEGQSAFAHDARFPVELAGIEWRKKQSVRAKAYLRQGLRLEPANTYANEFLGSLYLLDGNLYAALKYWNLVRRPVLSEVIFAPHPPLRPELLDRLSAVSAGQLLTVARLAQTERNLERLGIFSDPRFDLTPATNEEYRLTVRSQMLTQSLSGLAGRLLPLLRGLPYQQINLDWFNIERRAIRLTSLWRWDSDKRRIALEFRSPLAHGSYALWTDLRDEDWDLNRSGVAPVALGVRSAAVGGEVQMELNGGIQWSPGIRLSRHTFRNGRAQPWFANSTVWEVCNRFVLPSWLYPEQRVRIESSVTARTGRVFSRASSRLLGAEFDTAARWFPQERDDLYAVRARVRAGSFFGRLPVDEFYITAMERDNDLWLRGHAGTRDGRKGAAPMGTRFVLTQTELTRRLLRIPFLRIDAGPFVDTANIGGEAALGSHGWLYDAGAQAILTTLGGVRFSIIYGRDMRDGANVLYTAVSR
jgi:hypothetical protein